MRFNNGMNIIKELIVFHWKVYRFSLPHFDAELIIIARQ